MKLISKIAVTTSIVLAVAGASAFAIATKETPADPPVKKQSAKVVEKQETIAEPVTKEVPAETAPVETTPVVEPVAAPVVLSTQEYADKWLDMDSYRAQICLNRVVAQWPDRFTPEVRERNIKGLRRWAGICSTGAGGFEIDRREAAGYYGIQGTLIYAYGTNGEYFDTPGAMSHWND